MVTAALLAPYVGLTILVLWALCALGKYEDRHKGDRGEISERYEDGNV